MVLSDLAERYSGSNPPGLSPGGMAVLADTPLFVPSLLPGQAGGFLLLTFSGVALHLWQMNKLNPTRGNDPHASPSALSRAAQG